MPALIHVFDDFDTGVDVYFNDPVQTRSPPVQEGVSGLVWRPLPFNAEFNTAVATIYPASSYILFIYYA